MRTRQRGGMHRGWFAALLVGLWIGLAPGDGRAGHLDGEQLRDSGIEIEVEDLEIEADGHRVEVDYQVDASDWRRSQEAGVSLWMGVFDKGASGQWQLWYALPLVADDGSAIFPRHLNLGRAHVVVRLLGVSNGRYLAPGHGVFADGSILAGVGGVHEDDHSHDSDDSSVRRHVELEHRTTALQSTTMTLSYVGTLHQFNWFAPRFGFHRFSAWLRRQSLMTKRYRHHLEHHHHYGCSGRHSRSHHHGGGGYHRRTTRTRTFLYRHGTSGR